MLSKKIFKVARFLNVQKNWSIVNSCTTEKILQDSEEEKYSEGLKKKIPEFNKNFQSFGKKRKKKKKIHSLIKIPEAQKD